MAAKVHAVWYFHEYEIRFRLSRSLICITFGVMLIREAYQMVRNALTPEYENREASAMSDMLMEEITGLDRSARLIHHDKELTKEQEEKLQDGVIELSHGRPIQYVIGHVWFCGMRFKVDERVLIPRPETEELVELIKETYKDRDQKNEYTIRVLDIGTGSGCIPISLKKYFPEWEIWSLDKSAGALELARQNAILLEADVHFSQSDILNDAKNGEWKGFDIIVSNPPYILQEESKEIARHVLEHEPHMALFTTNDDPLQFYHAILDFCDLHLMRGGKLFFETHADYAEHVATIMEDHDFTEVMIQKDMQEKNRMVFGTRSGSSL
jgi:release factor glutamine methyltransferase